MRFGFDGSRNGGESGFRLAVNAMINALALAMLALGPEPCDLHEN